jgi:hypothetical protein
MASALTVERVQTGVRIEKRLLKVLKALSEHRDMSLGELLEGIVLHALEGRQPFSRATLELIAQLRQIYGLELDAGASHRLMERPVGPPRVAVASPMPRVRSTHHIELDLPADRAFMLFTPAGEELWVDGWAPRYLWPGDGHTREGMVFTTGHGSECTIWLLADFDPGTRRSRYVRTTPGCRAGVVEIACDPVHEQRCRLDVTYDMTALEDSTDDVLAPYREAALVQMVEGWAARIAERLPQLGEARLR